MTRYVVRFNTTLSVAVTVEAEDEEQASYEAWEKAEEYARTIGGNYRDVIAEASFDGIGDDGVEALS